MIAEPVIVSGASGFVGSRLSARMPAARALPLGAQDWRARLEREDFRDALVFHCAARAHQAGAVSDAAMMDDNAGKTRELAERAARGGARHLVFLSSIKVHGEESRWPFSEEDPPAPEDAYARSKLAAERFLRDVAGRTGLAVTILRPPLVYGANAKGNLQTLMRWVDTPWPLPFGALRNRRSFIHVEDLVEAMLACAGRPAPGLRVFLVAHAQPVSSARLIAVLRAALQRPARLYAAPRAALEAAAHMAGAGAAMRRLTRSLEADPARIARSLGWTASRDIETVAAEMARAWRSRAA